MRIDFMTSMSGVCSIYGRKPLLFLHHVFQAYSAELLSGVCGDSVCKGPVLQSAGSPSVSKQHPLIQSPSYQNKFHPLAHSERTGLLV